MHACCRDKEGPKEEFVRRVYSTDYEPAQVHANHVNVSTYKQCTGMGRTIGRYACVHGTPPFSYQNLVSQTVDATSSSEVTFQVRLKRTPLVFQTLAFLNGKV
jgi:hypothetical protein